MNRIVTTVVSMLAGFVVLNGAGAQQHAVRAIIPFDFTAAGTLMHAGTYTIRTRGGLTSILEDSTGKLTFVAVAPVVDNQSDDHKLIFSNSGEQHVLRQVLCPEINMNLELLPSKSESRRAGGK